MLTTCGLGTPEIRWKQARLDLSSRKAEALLYYLSFSGPHGASRNRVAELLWPSASTMSRALHSLNEAVYRIRKATTGNVIEAPRAGTLSIASGLVTSDVDKLYGHIRSGSHAGVMSSFHGQFMFDYAAPWSERFESWICERRERIWMDVFLLLMERAKKSEELENWDEAASISSWLLERRFDADAAALHVRCLCMTGYRALGREKLESALRAADGLGLSVQQRNPLEEVGRWLDSGAGGGPATSPKRQALPFVGRVSEQAHLLELLGSVSAAGAGVVVAVTGERGIGKSRLCQRFIRHATLRGARVFSTSCVYADAARPFGAAIDLIRSGLAAYDLPKLAPLWRYELSRLLPDIREDAAARDADGRYGVHDGELATEAVWRYFACVAADSPTVLLLDDFDRVDAASAACMESIASRRREAQLLLVLSCSSPPRTPLTQRIVFAPDTERLQLQGLAEDAVRELLGAVNASEAVARAARWCHGHPHLISEAIAHEREGVGAPSFNAAIARRMLKIPPEDRDQLRLLAVLGRATRTELLLGQPLRPLASVLSAAISEDLVVAAGSVFQVTQPIVRDHLLASMTAADRRATHYRAAFIAALRTPPDSKRAAECFAEAGASHLAFQHALHAASGAERDGGYGDSARYLELAARTAPDQDAELDVQLRLANLLHDLDRHSEADEILREIEDTAAEGRPRQIIKAHRLELLAESAGEDNLSERLRAFLGSLGGEAPNVEAEIRALRALATLEQRAGRKSILRSIGQRLANIRGLPTDRRLDIEARRLEAATLLAENRRKALALSKAVVHECRELPDASLLTATLRIHAAALLHNGFVDGAMAAFSEALTLAQDIGGSIWTPYILNDLGVAASESGDHALSLRCLGEGLETIGPHHTITAAFMNMNLAVSCYEAGEHERALAICNATLSRHANDDRMFTAMAHGVAGLIARARKDDRLLRHHCEQLEAMDAVGQGLGDAAYIVPLVCSVAESEGRLEDAVATVNGVILREGRRNILSLQRLLLEKARLLKHEEGDWSRSMATRIRTDAERSGARLVASAALRLLLRFRDGAHGEARPPAPYYRGRSPALRERSRSDDRRRPKRH